MSWHLAFNNLSVKAIKTALGVSSLRAIFYKGTGLTTLKTTAELGTLIDKRWLSNSYCPGADDDAQLQNLLTDRRLSYLKYYGYDDNVNISPSYGVSLQINATWIASPGWSSGNYYQSQFSTSSMTIEVSNYEDLGFTLQLQFYVNNVLQTGMTQTITGNGTYFVSLPSAMSYPSTFAVYVNSL